MKELSATLSQNRLDLVSLRDVFSLSSPAGRLHARILASVAEYETEIRAERVHAGQQVARRKGKTWGGSEKGWRWRTGWPLNNKVWCLRSLAGSRIENAGISE